MAAACSLSSSQTVLPTRLASQGVDFRLRAFNVFVAMCCASSVLAFGLFGIVSPGLVVLARFLSSLSSLLLVACFEGTVEGASVKWRVSDWCYRCLHVPSVPRTVGPLAPVATSRSPSLRGTPSRSRTLQSTLRCGRNGGGVQNKKVCVVWCVCLSVSRVATHTGAVQRERAGACPRQVSDARAPGGALSGATTCPEEFNLVGSVKGGGGVVAI